MRKAGVAVLVVAVVTPCAVVVWLWRGEPTRQAETLQAQLDASITDVAASTAAPALAPPRSEPTNREEGERWAARFARRGAPASDPRFYDDLLATGPDGVAALGAVLSDRTTLHELRDGDLRAGLGPRGLSLRGNALVLLEALVVHPRADGETREAAAGALAAIVAVPAPDFASQDATELLLAEKGRALAWLLRFSPQHGGAAFDALEDPLERLFVRQRARTTLHGMGMHRGQSRAALAPVVDR